MGSAAGGQRADMQRALRHYSLFELTFIIYLGHQTAGNESEVTAEINSEEKVSAFSAAGEATSRGIAPKTDQGVEGHTLDLTRPEAGGLQDRVEEAITRSLRGETEGETTAVRAAGLEEETALMKRKETETDR
jgi:hypothetical protein